MATYRPWASLNAALRAMPRVHSAIGSLPDPARVHRSVLKPQSSAPDRLPELGPKTRQVQQPISPHPPKMGSPRSVRGAARTNHQTSRRRPAPLLMQPPDGARNIQPTPPSIPSSSGSPWDQLQQYGGGWMSHRTPRPYNGLSGPSPLAAKLVQGNTTPLAAPPVAGPSAVCPHCEKLRTECDQLKRELKSQRADYATLEKQRRRLDQKLLDREHEDAVRALEDQQRAAIASEVASRDREQLQDQELFGTDQLIGGDDAELSLDTPASPPAGIPLPSPSPLASPSPSPSPAPAPAGTPIVRPAPMPDGATDDETAWVRAAETEGFVIVAGPALLGDGQPWGRKRLAVSAAQRRCVVLATRSAGQSPLSATKHFLLVRPPTEDAVQFDELTHVIALAGTAVGCTVTEGHSQCGRLRVMPSPSTTMQIPGGTYVEELWLSSLKIADLEALEEMKQWATLLQPLTFE